MRALTTRHGSEVRATVWAEDGTETADLGVTGEGVARCRPDDVFVRMTGERIAVGRAIQDFGRKVEEAGLAESISQETLKRVEFVAAAVLAEALVGDQAAFDLGG